MKTNAQMYAVVYHEQAEWHCCQIVSGNNMLRLNTLLKAGQNRF